MELNWIEAVVEYGIFAFAVMFCIFLTRWGQKKYSEVCTRTEPLASDKEKNTYRLYFFGVAGFGILLVIVCSIYWITKQETLHTFEGIIRDLPMQYRVSSNELFLRQVWLGPGGGDEIRDEYFVAIQKKPFKENRKFKIRFSKGENWKREQINYRSSYRPEYLWHADENNNNEMVFEEIIPTEEKINPSDPSSSPLSLNHGFSGVLYASELKKDNKETVKSNPLTRNEPINVLIVELLQTERTNADKKIESLEKLNELGDEDLIEYLHHVTDKEPMVLTLLDLSRHTDAELAYKAKKLINERFNLDDFIRNKLESDEDKERSEAELILFRIEKDRALGIIQPLLEREENPWFNELQDRIEAGNETKVLIPTGSFAGDRYYVMAKWDERNNDKVECLTKLFNTILLSDRSYEDEVSFMENRNKRYVYWYSKEWAINISERIKNCGGKAEFIGFYPPKR